MVLVGIAPGLSGALAVLRTDGWLMALHDTPVLALSTRRSRAGAVQPLPLWEGAHAQIL